MVFVQMCAHCGGENPEGFRFCGLCGAPLAARFVVRRKLATMVFCDVVGSTALGERADAETVHVLMYRYFGEMRAALERHGGTVEKFVGDAVLAVFGVPDAHEDDALRACRAALEMHARMASLSEELERRYGTCVALRIGVNSGEVIAGDSSRRETFVTGDAVNVAARLEQAASPGEVLIGEETYRLVGGAVTVEEVAPVDAKGKSAPVTAFRLIDVREQGREPHRTVTPLVGRAEPLSLLEREFETVVGKGHCRLVTVVGEPGIGKSRLTLELVDRVGSRARVIRGACLSYGEGITYWAVSEMVRELAGIHDEHTPSDVQARIREFVADEPYGEVIAARIEQLLGISAGASTPTETAWAIRRFLAAGAAQQPLLLIIDNIHWAEPLLLELLAGLPAGLEEVRVLVVCLARPELLEHHADWHATIRLEPLTSHEADALVRGLYADSAAELRERLVRVSSGNPLFVEELVAWTRDEHLDPAALPTSLTALLNARLDQLDTDGRGALERGAVEGEVFHRGAVVALSTPASRDSIPARLEVLAAKDLIHAATPSYANEQAFRFKHILVRDAAYQSTTKKLRARLHKAFADWLETVAGERASEYEEILGYHLEQSHRYLTELGPSDRDAEALAARAARHLLTAGRRARDRGDLVSTASLLSRAADLDARDRPTLLTDIGEALYWVGDYGQALVLLDEAADTARAGGDEAAEQVARLLRAVVESHTADPSLSIERVRARADHASNVLELVGNDVQLALALEVAASRRFFLGRAADAVSVYRRALEHARRADDLLRVRECIKGVTAAMAWGPSPVSEFNEFVTSLPNDLRRMQSLMHCYSGRFAEARAAYTDEQTRMAERGNPVQEAAMRDFLGIIELYAGNPTAAELVLRHGYNRLGELGAQGHRSTTATLLADALVQLGRLDDAMEVLDVADDIANHDDVDAQVRSRAVRARILAHRGDLTRAKSLVREAVERASRTDFIVLHADALVALADVLRGSGAAEQAAVALGQALELYERKEDVVRAEQTRALLPEVERSPRLIDAPSTSTQNS